MQAQHRLLVGALDRREPHRRSCHRLADRFRIRGIGLVGLDEWLDIVRRDQSNLVAHPLQLTRPVVRAGASLHADKTGRQSGEKVEYLAPAQLLAKDWITVMIRAMNLEDRLCQIQTDCSNVRHVDASCRWFV